MEQNVDRFEETSGRFDPDDVRIDHMRLGSGRGALRITHLPTGLSTLRELAESPVLQVQAEMLRELQTLIQNLEK